MPRYPFLPGICISSAASFTTSLSGVTISSSNVSAIVQSLVARRWSSANKRWSFLVAETLDPGILVKCDEKNRRGHGQSSAACWGSWAFANDQRPDDHRLLLRCRLHLLGSFEHFVDRPLHIERLLRDIVVLARNNVAESLHRVRDFYVASRRSRELLGHVERLRQEALNLASPCHGHLLIFAQLVDA